MEQKMDIKESYSFWELTGIIAGGIVALLFALWRMAKWVFGEYKKVVTERDAARQINIEKTYNEIGAKLDKNTKAVESLAKNIESQERNFNKRFEQVHEEIRGIDNRVKALEQKK